MLSRWPVFQSFHYVDFRWMFVGSLASYMAMNMQMITRGWLVLELADDSPLALALVMASFSMPVTIMAIIGGALADRIPRKRMVILSQGGNILVTALVATLDMTNIITFGMLLGIGVVNGSLMALNMPSRQAILSDIVPEGTLMNAISLTNSAMNATRIAGPAVAGVLIIFMGTHGVFYLIAATYALAVLSVVMIRAGQTPASRSRRGLSGDIGEGIRYVRSNPPILGVNMLMLISSLFGFAYFALMPAWGREALDVGSDDLGFLLMVMGIGALVGTLGLAAMGNVGKRGLLLFANCVGWAVGLMAFSQMTSFWAAVPLLLFTGLVSSLVMSLAMTLVQVYASPEMRGRVMSLGMMTFGIQPLSSIPLGFLAVNIGTPDALFITGVLLLVGTVALLLVYPGFRRVD